MTAPAPDRRVVVLGASASPEKFSHRALLMLATHGWPVVPVHPALSEVAGHPVTARLTDLSGPVHTLTLYVGPAVLAGLTEEILRLQPGRVIFNPGTGCPPLQQALSAAGIPWTEDCTLLMLQGGRF